jgi:putative transcriptional regulator
MQALFVELPAFARHRLDYLDDEGFRGLQNALLDNPEAGDVIEGTGGLRKVRYADARRGKGKRGGLSRYLLLVERGGSVLALHALRQGHDRRFERQGTRSTERHVEARAERKEKAMKRNVFSELTEGFDALKVEREGKITLRTHAVKRKPAPAVTAKELVSIRQSLKLSRAVFARYLRANERTLENWEQGRAKPNAQAALLIRLVARYPDTVKRLAAV